MYIHNQSVSKIRPDLDEKDLLYFCTSLYRKKSCCELFNILVNTECLKPTFPNFLQVPAQCEVNKNYQTVPFNYSYQFTTSDISDFQWTVLHEIYDKINPAMLKIPKFIIDMHIKKIKERENLSIFKERVAKCYFNCDYATVYSNIIRKEILNYICCAFYPCCNCT